MIALNLIGIPYGRYIDNSIIIYTILGLFFILIVAIYYYQYLSKNESNVIDNINSEKPIFQNLDVLMQEKNIDFM